MLRLSEKEGYLFCSCGSLLIEVISKDRILMLLISLMQQFEMVMMELIQEINAIPGQMIRNAIE